MNRIALALLFALYASCAPAQEAGYCVRATEVKADPFSDAATVATLAEKAPVRILARQGGWMRVESGAASGWVRMLSVRTGGAEGLQSGDSGVKELFNVARTGRSGTAVATGVRGLDREQIRNAQPNPAELQKMGGYSASAGEAEQFAARAGLAQHAVDYLQPPAAPASGASAAQQPFSSAP